MSTQSESLAKVPKSHQVTSDRKIYPSSLPRPAAAKKEKHVRMTCSNQNSPRTTIPVEKQELTMNNQEVSVISASMEIIEEITLSGRTPVPGSASKRRATEEIQKSNKAIKMAPNEIVEQACGSTTAPDGTFLSMDKETFFEEMKEFVSSSKASVPSPTKMKRRASLVTVKQTVGSPSRWHSAGKIKNATVKATMSSPPIMIRRTATFGPAV